MCSMADGYILSQGEGETGTGEGDMKKSVYDTDNDGIVDEAETLNENFIIEGGNF